MRMVRCLRRRSAHRSCAGVMRGRYAQGACAGVMRRGHAQGACAGSLRSGHAQGFMRRVIRRDRAQGSCGRNSRAVSGAYASGHAPEQGRTVVRGSGLGGGDQRQNPLMAFRGASSGRDAPVRPACASSVRHDQQRGRPTAEWAFLSAICRQVPPGLRLVPGRA